MNAVPVVRIHPCEAHQCPGHDSVEINESDFDPKKGHVLFDETDPDTNADGKVTARELRAALDAQGIAHKASMSKAELQALLDAA